MDTVAQSVDTVTQLVDTVASLVDTISQSVDTIVKRGLTSWVLVKKLVPEMLLKCS